MAVNPAMMNPYYNLQVSQQMMQMQQMLQMQRAQQAAQMAQMALQAQMQSVYANNAAMAAQYPRPVLAQPQMPQMQPLVAQPVAQPQVPQMQPQVQVPVQSPIAAQPQAQTVPVNTPQVQPQAQPQTAQTVNQTQAVGFTDAQKRVPGYKNDLRDMLLTNKSQMLAVIPRIMNSQDTDGNGLIQGDEKPGTFVNAVERLDEIKELGFNTQHILPIHPTGKTNAMGLAGSLYSPSELLQLDPELVDENPPAEARAEIEKLYEQKTGKKLEKMDKNDPEVVFAQCKYYIDECHKRGIKLMLDLPSCVSLDFKEKYPEMMAIDNEGKDKTPKGWQDIRMLAPFKDEVTRELNKDVLDLHKKYVDMAVELGFDGIRADVGRAKPTEFWDVIIKYSHALDPQFAWLAETYTHEDASPMLNMPYDRPDDLLRAGFDTYYGQWHIYNDMTTNQQFYDYVKENIDLNNSLGQAKSLIGSFATHDDVSPMLYGGAPWVMFTTTLQSMIPQCNPYMTDGVQTGDYYIFPYDHAHVEESETDCHEATVHTGRMDIFNKSRKPGGDCPEIADTVKAAFALRSNEYNDKIQNGQAKLQMNDAQDVITKGSFIILPSNNPEIVSFARHKDGKTLLFIGNRNVNKKVGGKIEIPGLKPDQQFKNLMPAYGEECKFQNNKDGSINVELGTSRACIFEIDDADIQNLSKPENVMQQKYL